MNELSTGQSFSLTPKSLDEAMRFAEIISKSDIVPKEFKGNPGNVLVAIQWGLELGLQAMQALQNISVINGRPALWGDAVIALVRSSPLCEYIYETDDGSTATIRVKRRGEEEQFRTFSMEDAQKAGLLNRGGAWQQYPKRMRQMRARAFALRDVFPDVLRGMPVAEEIQDMTHTEKDITPYQTPQAPKQLEHYPQDDFDTNYPKWAALIESGKRTADQIVQIVSQKAPLTDEQKQSILELAPAPETVEQDTWEADYEAASQEQKQ